MTQLSCLTWEWIRSCLRAGGWQQTLIIIIIINDYREIMKFPKNGKCQVDTCFPDLFFFWPDSYRTPVEQPKMKAVSQNKNINFGFMTQRSLVYDDLLLAMIAIFFSHLYPVVRSSGITLNKHQPTWLWSTKLSLFCFKCWWFQGRNGSH